jgi:hypothetical protein
MLPPADDDHIASTDRTPEMPKNIPHNFVTALRGNLRGAAVLPGEEGYDAAPTNLLATEMDICAKSTAVLARAVCRHIPKKTRDMDVANPHHLTMPWRHAFQGRRRPDRHALGC